MRLRKGKIIAVVAAVAVLTISIYGAIAASGSSPWGDKSSSPELAYLSLSEGGYKMDLTTNPGGGCAILSESGYKATIMVNPAIERFSFAEGGHKLSLSIYHRGIPGRYEESGYKLTLGAKPEAIIQYTLTINVVGSGATSPEAGIHSYPSGTEVELTATPDEGWKFTGWSGDITDPLATTSITLGCDKEVTATFLKTTIIVPDDYTTIQAAVNAADIGDTVLVKSGTYYENVVVNKSIILKGDGMPVVDAGGSGSAITLTADNCTVEGFEVQGCIPKSPYAGIRVESNSNVISNNIGTGRGGYIYLWKCLDNKIAACSFNDGSGIITWESYGNEVTDCYVNGKPLIYLENESEVVVTSAGQVVLVNCQDIEVKNCTLSSVPNGIELWGCSNCKLENNTFANDGTGISLRYSFDNTINNNSSVRNSRGIYLYNSSNNTLENNICSENYCGFLLQNSTYNRLSGNNASNNGWGMQLNNSSHNDIIGNTASFNKLDPRGDGINLHHQSSSNKIKDNRLSNNADFGISIDLSSNTTIIGNVISGNWLGIGIGMLEPGGSSGNLIYHNNFIDNGACDNDASNYWDNGWEGSFWSDYGGMDADGNGIGDTPYEIPGDAGAKDNYPLMNPYGITKIADIWAYPAVYEGKTVTISGEYRGWEAGHGSPPVTRSDWIIQDNSGSIYVTGKLPGLRPYEDIGKSVRVKGVVKLKDGQPYIEAETVGRGGVSSTRMSQVSG